MKTIAVAIAMPILVFTSWAQSGPAKQERNSKMMQPSDVIDLEGIDLVAPALERYAQGPVAELWNRPGLSRRDRSMITLAALIARNQTIEMAQYVDHDRTRAFGRRVLPKPNLHRPYSNRHKQSSGQ